MFHLGFGHAFFLRLLRRARRHGSDRLSVRRGFLGLEITHALGVLVGNFQISERRPDRVALAFFRAQLGQLSVAWRDDAHDRFVRFDFHHIAVADHIVAGLGHESDDGGFGDRFAELRHEERDAGHKSYWVRSWRRRAATVVAVGRCAAHKSG